MNDNGQILAHFSQFTPRAALCALALKLQQLDLLKIVRTHLNIPQKCILYPSADKVEWAFIAILAGAKGINELNTRLRNDKALQRAFGHCACAEQSTVQDTLNATTADNVVEMEAALDEIFHRYSRAYRHDYKAGYQLLDIDFTGQPCGPTLEASRLGYFDKEIRYGRQLGRVLAAHYQEIVVDRLYAGNIQLNATLRQLVATAEMTLGLDEEKRRRTIVRMDAGGGSFDDINWLLKRGYQLHCKEVCARLAQKLAHTVKKWVADTKVPNKEFGWADPERSWIVIAPYVRPVRRVVMRQRRKDGAITYASLLISTLEPAEVIALLHLPAHTINDEAAVLRAYSHLYDQRAGTVEVEIKEDKQGIGITKRNKKRFCAQQMVMMLGTLAHNVLVWARNWLAAVSPRFLRYGILRMVRDILATPGMVKVERNFITAIALDDTNRITDDLVKALRAILPKLITVDLGYG